MSAIPAGAIARAAAAIANERAARSGAPRVENVLDILPDKLRQQFLADAKAALDAAGFGELLAACRMVASIAVSWQAITPGDIREVKVAIASAEKPE